MPGFAIRAEGLSKAYRIRHARARYDTLRDEIGRLPSRVLRRRGTPDSETVWAVNDVSFEIEQGELVGVIGRNGAGKTTLLRLLSRITEPTRGYADVVGRLGTLLEVGTGFHPELTGRENVFLNGAVLGMRRAEVIRKFDQIVEFAGVEKFIDTPVKRYSSGMQVRLAFSVAAHLEPEILIVDEVLAVGDLDFQKRSLGKLDDVGRSGRTVLFVSHNMETVTRLCNRAILLEGGRVAADGSVEDVVARYLSGAHGTAAERRWTTDAPGNDYVRLATVRVVDGGMRTAPTIDVRETVGVELVFDVLQKGRQFVPWLALYNDQGKHVFSAMDTNPEWLTPREEGTYRATAWIPPNLLNEGTIVASVSLNTFTSGDGARQAYADDVISFQVIDPGEGDTARGTYPGIWTAPVRPLLEWTTDFMTGSDHPSTSRASA
jgi:lipopolysaccharide transport system ATP-binding protein